ncbi:hypothetical protein ACH5RR_008809 [Cinchona calisaya]|uniref:Uncharacterized protein n=1 Tax=Cinchona calisaya TaxID=153742 RepID=A0ABD3AG89_9GENT
MRIHYNIALMALHPQPSIISSKIHPLPPPTWHYGVPQELQLYAPHMGTTQAKEQRPIRGIGPRNENGRAQVEEFEESQHERLDNVMVIEDINKIIGEA